MPKRRKNRKNRFMAGSSLLQSDPTIDFTACGGRRENSQELQSVHVIPKLLAKFCIYMHYGTSNSGMQLISSLLLKNTSCFLSINQLQRGPLRSRRFDVRLPMNCVDLARSQKNARENSPHRVNPRYFHDMARSASCGNSSTVQR